MWNFHVVNSTLSTAFQIDFELRCAKKIFMENGIEFFLFFELNRFRSYLNIKMIFCSSPNEAN